MNDTWLVIRVDNYDGISKSHKIDPFHENNEFKLRVFISCKAGLVNST